MKQKQGLDLAAVILLLLIACAALAVPVALLSPKWLIAPAVLVVAALGVLWYQRRRLRTFVAKNLCSTDFENSRIQYSLTGLPIPTMLIADGRDSSVTGVQTCALPIWSAAAPTVRT